MLLKNYPTKLRELCYEHSVVIGSRHAWSLDKLVNERIETVATQRPFTIPFLYVNKWHMEIQFVQIITDAIEFT